jgi:ankyrin repeat protein
MEVWQLEKLYEANADREALLDAYKEILAEKGAAAGRELAFTAARFTHPEALELLFEEGVDPSTADKYAFSLFHHAARRDYRFYKAAEGDAERTAELLLEKGVSVLRKDENEGLACYHYAARNGFWELLEVLAKHGSKLTLCDSEGNTGIHIAAIYVRHHPEREDDYVKTVKAFIAGGVDPGEKNQYGKSAAEFAVESNAKKVAAAITGEKDSAAASMTIHLAAEKDDIDAIKALAAAGADLNLLNDKPGEYNGLSALAIACAFVNVKAAAALLECGADPAFKDNSGRIALGFLLSVQAQVSVNTKVFEERRIPAIFKAMIDKGLSINETADDESNTILILASKSQR